jgi:hypothetical protein
LTVDRRNTIVGPFLAVGPGRLGGESRYVAGGRVKRTRKG